MSEVVDVDAYLARIGLTDAPPINIDGLTLLQRAHLATVPFENLDVVAGIEVRTDLEWSLDKVVNRRRGGWCFEVNGAFAALLTALGFEVMHLAAAVLLSGPNKVVDHLALEVMLDQAYLADVGFGESFVHPLKLNERSAQQDPAGVFELIDSSEGLTVTKHDDAGIPVPQYRFRRIHHELHEFEATSTRLRSDESLMWSQKPFATRIVDPSVEGNAERITLKKDRLTRHGHGTPTNEPVDAELWDAVLAEHFSIDRAGKFSNP